MNPFDNRPLCARFKKRQPALCSPLVSEATCECGKVYRRCENHGGTDGAIKSRASHRGMDCWSRRP